MNGNKLFSSKLLLNRFFGFEKSLICINNKKNFFSFIQNVKNKTKIKRQLYSNFHFNFFNNFGGFGGGQSNYILLIKIYRKSKC